MRCLPTNNAKPKYSHEPHPLLRLSRLALPVGASTESIERAVEAFSYSITRDTQSGYATAARHFFEAEKELGRKFNIPPNEAKLIFLTCYFIKKDLTVPTIRNYMAGIRFYLLSLGIAAPPKLPPLPEQLLVGRVNQVRNPALLASKKTKRAISLEILKLLGHGIARNNVWSDYEKNLRWAVFLTAWWGSFRIGELLSKSMHQFHPSSALLASGI